MLRVLKNRQMIVEARKRLAELGCDSTRGFARTRFQMSYLLRFRKAAPQVAVNKSWDVLSIVEAVEKYCPDKRAQIFDMGSYNCEAPLALWWRGYRNIRAADLNPKGRCIRWYGNNIDFHCEDFYRPALADGSVDVDSSAPRQKPASRRRWRR